ncbi:MAG: gamma-glutamyl-gamma-aminobutyrate hydrolase family protein [bacterium]
MKVALFIKNNINKTNPRLYNEYIDFASIIQSKINEKTCKNYEFEIVDINRTATKTLASSDIIILTGGEDVHPSYYNSFVKYNNELYSFNKQRDEIELEILHKYHQSKCFFGICRGIQIINVFFGGNLFQHIPYDISDVVIEEAHRSYSLIKDSDKVRYLRHLIKLKLDSLITMEVNSRHHQAIAKIGKNLNVLAISKDGIVEVVQHEYLPIFAVQYHPEQRELIDSQQLVIDWFVNMIVNKLSI